MHRPRRTRRCTDEYGGIEYGGLPVNYSIFVILLYLNMFRQRSNADNLCAYAARHKSLKSATQSQSTPVFTK
jgi:hypothetical protein